jgi:hypothetical protein
MPVWKRALKIKDNGKGDWGIEKMGRWILDKADMLLSCNRTGGWIKLLFMRRKGACIMSVPACTMHEWNFRVQAGRGSMDKPVQEVKSTS